MGLTDKLDNKRKRSKSLSNEKRIINDKMDIIIDATCASQE